MALVPTSELMKRKRGRPRRDEPPEYNINDSLLIDEFRKHPQFYDRSHPHYHNRELTAPLWAEIANRLNSRPQMVKDRMMQLRSRFSVERRRIESMQDQFSNETIKSQWPLYDQMLFLGEHLTTRPPRGQLIKPQPESDASDEDDRSVRTNAAAAGRVRNPPARFGMYTNLADNAERAPRQAASHTAHVNETFYEEKHYRTTNGIPNGFSHVPPAPRAAPSSFRYPEADSAQRSDKFIAYGSFLAHILIELEPVQACRLMQTFTTDLCDALTAEQRRV